MVDIVPKAIYDLMKRWSVTAPQTRLNSRTVFSSALLLQSSTATPLRAPVQNFSTLTETFCHEISCLEGRSHYSPIWWSYRGSQVSVHLEQRRAWVEPSVDCHNTLGLPKAISDTGYKQQPLIGWPWFQTGCQLFCVGARGVRHLKGQAENIYVWVNMLLPLA